ncbi:MAG: GHKL domain-containing protein [Deltaproteobacteria bacterium]|nr:GHKL domain-containing protein [Deltaproteobacteria bacterium]
MINSRSAAGIPIRWLLLGTNAIVFLLPLFALFGFRIYDTYLLRQTERQLIAQAIFVGEAWRAALLDIENKVELHNFKPLGRDDAAFIPIEPVIDLGIEILPPQPKVQKCSQIPQRNAQLAAQAMMPLLKRVQVFTLSAIRILDANGCVIATTRSELGMSLYTAPEVQAALDGIYNAVTRKRISDEPAPPLNDIRRRGNVRVFAALPIFAAGKVIGVVRISRTSMSAIRSLWLNRRGLLIAGFTCCFLIIIASCIFTAAITRPLRRLSNDAKSVTQGSQASHFAHKPWTPAEFKDLANSLAVMTTKLHERAEYISAYTANIAHELKTPITAIRGAAELLNDNIATMTIEQRQRFLTNIEADALRLERLVTQLLYLAKIENSASNLPVEEIDVHTFLKQMLSRYPERVHFDIDSRVTSISMNPEQLVSAITNLIDNALEQESTTRVELSAMVEDDRLVITVADNGSGIAPEYIDKIFNRFFTTKAERGGTGLGLSLVKAIAETRGGKITCESSKGHTKFNLVL